MVRGSEFDIAVQSESSFFKLLAVFASPLHSRFVLFLCLVTVLSGIRQDEILPPLPPEQATEQARLRSVKLSFLLLQHLNEILK